MECPHCKDPLPSISCSACDKEIPQESLYCLFCGNSVKPVESEQVPPEYDFEATDFEDRVLCPDGTCTGIIEEGRCVECGKSL